MSYPNLNGPTHFGEPSVRFVDYRESQTEFSPVEHKISYFNSSAAPVTVALRNGLKFTVPSKPSFTSSAFVVRVELRLSFEVKENVREVLSRVHEHSTPELQALKEAFMRQETPENFYSPALLVLEYPITYDQLLNYGGTVYYHELDLLVSLDAFGEVPPHPYSEEGRRMGLAVDAPTTLDKPSFGYSIEIVDSGGRIGARYLNISNEIYSVTPKSDPSKRDGVYVVTNRPLIGLGGVEAENNTVVKYYPATDQNFETLGLYASYTEAVSLGDSTTSRQTALAEMNHANLLLKGELERVKHENEIAANTRAEEEARFEAKQKEWDAERERHRQELAEARERTEHAMALKRLEVKDQYEERSLQRKDSSEVIKILPAIVVGIGAIFMAIKTFAVKALIPWL